jgi:hypothetical protein
MCRVLVCGGRHFQYERKLFETLDRIHHFRNFTFLMEGGAKGADKLAKKWRTERGIPGKTYDANWGKHPKAAGPIRNGEMLAHGKPDLVIAFAGMTGTADMVTQAKRACVEVIEIAPGGMNGGDGHG